MNKKWVMLPLAIAAFAFIAIACSSTPAASQPNTPLPAPTAETPPTSTPVPTVVVPTQTPQEPGSIPTIPILSRQELDVLQGQLDANIEKWRTSGMVDYDFEYQRSCFCPPDYRPLVNISVRNTSIDSITNVETETPVTENLELYTTVEGLFSIIQSALDNGVSNITVSYDAELGFPTDVYIDYNSMMADEELGFVVNRLNGPELPFPPFGNGGMSDDEAEELQDELDTNFVKWNNSGINDYTFQFRVSCFCPEDIRAPVLITVSDYNTIESITYVESGEPVTQYIDIYMTVGGVFDFIQEAIDQRAARVTVSYDLEYGYPKSAFVDRSFMIADEERGFEISSVIPLDPPTTEQIQSRLNTNRSVWQSGGFTDYEIEYRRICFCAPNITSPVIVTVANGAIESVMYAETREPVGEAVRDLFPDVNGMFDILQDALDQDAASIRASYDGRVGYPTNISIDYNTMIADEELGFSISSFKSLRVASLDEIQSELDANRDLWNSNNLSSYEFVYQRVCFCILESVQPVRVSVENGEIVSITFTETGLPVGDEFSDLYTHIDGLFDVIQDAVDNEAVSIRAVYNSELGFPTDVFIDYETMIADEEFGFVVNQINMGESSASINGHWEGTILIGEVELGILVNFVTDGSGLNATIDIPAQFVDDLRLSNVSIDGDNVHFEIMESQAVFDGTIEGDTISGGFQQIGVSATFALNRSEPVNDPIVVVEPLPYVEEEVTFQNGDVTFAGTLTIPEGNGPHPAVVMITGSGAQNRDEEIVGFKIFGVIADHLTRSGIAVLRYDDRGVGGSTGNLNESTIHDFSGDVLSAIALLKARPDINADQIGAVGHSEGGIVGPLAASNSEDVAFVVMIAGTGVPGEEILQAQLEIISGLGGATDEEIQEALQTQQRTFAAIRTGEGWDEVREAARQQVLDSLDDLPESQRAAITDVETFVNTLVEQQITIVQTPWYKSFLDYDPRIALESVTVPVLAVFGGLDVQVPADLNIPGIEEALDTAGNDDVTVEVFADANHLFQMAVTGNIDEYATLEKAFVPGFLNTMSSWIVDRTDVAMQ